MRCAKVLIKKRSRSDMSAWFSCEISACQVYFSLYPFSRASTNERTTEGILKKNVNDPLEVREQVPSVGHNNRNEFRSKEWTGDFSQASEWAKHTVRPSEAKTPPPCRRHRWEVDDRGGARRGARSGGGGVGGTSCPGAVSQHFFQALLLVERVEEVEDDSGGVEVAQSELRQMRGVSGEVSEEERCISIREEHPAENNSHSW